MFVCDFHEYHIQLYVANTCNIMLYAFMLMFHDTFIRLSVDVERPCGLSFQWDIVVLLNLFNHVNIYPTTSFQDIKEYRKLTLK